MANRVYLDEMDDLLEQPRCYQFADENDSINGTLTACLDLYSKQHKERKIARLCCCRGNDECNAEISEEMISKTIVDLKFVEEMLSNANYIDIKLILIISIILFVLLTLPNLL
uniref:Uncharacterized protein n=1 Tax=Elaeophora elaphi TaxID=1147741 RepID=A0A0R3RL16_9BILA